MKNQPFRPIVEQVNTNLSVLDTIATADVNPNAFLYYFDPFAPAGSNWKKIKITDISVAAGGITTIVSDSLAVTAFGTGRRIEVKTINNTRAGFLLLLGSGALVPGVIYNITNPIAPLTALWIQTTGVNSYNMRMAGMVGTTFVECNWSTVTNKNTMIFNPQLNNRVTRPAVDTTNCIENFPLTNANIKNCNVESCNISVNAVNTVINGLQVGKGSVISLNRTTLNDVKFEAGNTITIGDVSQYNLTRTRLAPGGFYLLNGGGSMTDCDIDYSNGVILTTTNNWNSINVSPKGSNLVLKINPTAGGLIDMNSDIANGSNLAGVITCDSAAFPLISVSGMSISPYHWRYLIVPTVDGFEVDDETVGGGNILYQGGGTLILNGASKDDTVSFEGGLNTGKAVVVDVAVH